MKYVFLLVTLFLFNTNSHTATRDELEIKSTQHALGKIQQEVGLPAGTEILIKRTHESPLISQLTYSFNWLNKVCVLKAQKTDWQPEACSVVWRDGYYQRICTPGYWKTIEFCGKEIEKLIGQQKTLRLDFSSIEAPKKGEEEFFLIDIIQEKIESQKIDYALSIVDSKNATAFEINEDTIVFK